MINVHYILFHREEESGTPGSINTYTSQEAMCALNLFNVKGVHRKAYLSIYLLPLLIPVPPKTFQCQLSFLNE